MVGVISFVAEEVVSAFELIEEFWRRGNVVDVAGSEQEAERPTDYICEDVNFCGISTSREADLLRFGPPFPPNAER